MPVGPALADRTALSSHGIGRECRSSNGVGVDRRLLGVDDLDFGKGDAVAVDDAML